MDFPARKKAGCTAPPGVQQLRMQLPDRGTKGPPLRMLSVVIPALDEAACIEATIKQLQSELESNRIAHEVIVVNDRSTDQTWEVLQKVATTTSTVRPINNEGLHGFGRAVAKGIDAAAGDAVVVVMADQSDDCRDVVRYWQTLNEGWDCVFGSRFIKGGQVIDYPWLKLLLNRLANFFIRVAFGIPLNDTTNAFKAYRKTALDGCRPFLSPHFNLTVELPLKAIVRGYSWKVIPITWRSRRTGAPKLKIKEMGSRYFFIIAYVWLEKYFSRGDYRKSGLQVDPHFAQGVEETRTARP